MSRSRSLGTVLVAALVALLLASCGGTSKNVASTTPLTSSQLDPAGKVPAAALVYALVTVKPQGALRADLVQTIDALAGPGTADRLAGELTREIAGTAQLRTVKSWIGPRVGLALTGLPTGRLRTSNAIAMCSWSFPAASRRSSRATSWRI